MNELLTDIAKVLEGFEKGIFVRDISRDYEPGWAVKLLPYLTALVNLKTKIVIPKESSKDGGG